LVTFYQNNCIIIFNGNPIFLLLAHFVKVETREVCKLKVIFDAHYSVQMVLIW